MKAPVPQFFFNKVAPLRLETFLKKRLWYRCFPMNFAEFLRTIFFHRTPPFGASGPVSVCTSQFIFFTCKITKQECFVKTLRLKLPILFWQSWKPEVCNLQKQLSRAVFSKICSTGPKPIII